MPTLRPTDLSDEEVGPVTTEELAELVVKARRADIRMALDDADTALLGAVAKIRRWHAGPAQDVPGATYVAAGQEAVECIDDALKALHTARAGLITELRADGDARNARVDAMLAERRTEELR